MKNIKISLFGFLDMLKFKNMSKDRDKFIEKGKNVDIDCKYPINEKANDLHPKMMKLIVSEIIDHGFGLKSFVFKSEDKLPYFKAGQYVSLKFNIGGSFVSRAYGIDTSPSDALKGKIGITVKKMNDGFVSKHICDNLKVGDIVYSSSPEGKFYYEPLRDGKDVVALVGSIGITPIISMFRAIKDKDEKFNLTIIYGAKNINEIFAKEELEEAAKNNIIKLHYVFEDTTGAENTNIPYDKGFITKEIIEKYSTKDCSYFITGPVGMIDSLVDILEKNKVLKKYIRIGNENLPNDLSKEEGYDISALNKTFKLTVKMFDEEKVIEAKSNDTLLISMEKNGIYAQSKCRFGECSFCRSKVLSGKYFVAKKNEFRRWSDIKYDYIHPCVTYPLSDIVIELPSKIYT